MPVLIVLAVVGALIIMAAIVSRYREWKASTPSFPKTPEKESSQLNVSQSNISPMEKTISDIARKALTNVSGGAVFSKATLKINVNGQEKEIDISQGVPEDVVQKMAQSTHLTPEAAREFLAGHMDAETLKKLSPDAKINQVVIKREIKKQWNIGGPDLKGNS